MKKMILPVLLIAMLILTTTVSAYTFGTGMKYIRGTDTYKPYYDISGSIGKSGLSWKIADFTPKSAYLETSYYQPITKTTGISPYIGTYSGETSAYGIAGVKNFGKITTVGVLEGDLTGKEWAGAGAAVVKYKVDDSLSIKATGIYPFEDKPVYKLGIEYSWK